MEIVWCIAIGWSNNTIIQCLKVVELLLGSHRILTTIVVNNFTAIINNYVGQTQARIAIAMIEIPSSENLRQRQKESKPIEIQIPKKTRKFLSNKSFEPHR